MALYAIGDLHLCLGAPKPMDIFGGAWVGYMDKLKEGMSVIGPEDTTVLLGDLSWALDLASSRADFAWINEIPGRKIILKGNHDYWWSTVAKFDKFCAQNEFHDMHILNNNQHILNNHIHNLHTLHNNPHILNNQHIHNNQLPHLLFI